MRPRWHWIGVVVLAGVAAPRAARARSEMSLQAPMGVAVGDGARFELGLRSDLLYLFDSGDTNLGFGITGEVRSVSFSRRAQEIGAAFAALGRVQRGSYMGVVLDAGYGTEEERHYLYSRCAYQFRVRIPNDDRGLAYALTSSVFVAGRGTVSGPGGLEGVAGVEIGGGFAALLLRGLISIALGG
jgi:hypothetical protein